MGGADIRATKQWIQYSEGFMIQQYPDFMRVSFQGETKNIPYPDWWFEQ